MGAARAQEFLAVQSLTLTAAALWLARLWLQPQPRLLWPPACWGVLAFTAYAVTRYFFADLEYLARQELARVVCYAVIFSVVLQNLHRQESVKIISFTLIGVAFLIAGYALAQFCTGNFHVWKYDGLYPGRATGTYVCPNHLAGLLELTLPLALAWALVSRAKLWLKILLGYAALVMAGALVTTLSRGGWLAAGLSLVAFTAALVLRRSVRWRALLALVGLLVVAGFLAARNPTVQFRFQRIFGDQAVGEQVEEVRFQFWKPALEIWQENFWCGAGPDAFTQHFPAHRPAAVQLRPTRAHNDYLNTLADWGVVGLALVLATVGCVATGVARTWTFARGNRRDLGDNRSDKFALLLGAATALLALLLHSALDFNMHIPANALIAVTLLALLTAQLRFATEKFWARAATFPRLALTLALLAAIIFLGVQGLRRTRELCAEEKVLACPLGSLEQIAALEKQFAVEPKNFATAYALGDAFRLRSMDGNRNYAALGTNALVWLNRSRALNPYDALTCVRLGMTLDWLGRLDEGGAAFARAETLDPNGNFTVAHLGWHQVQLGDWAAARACFERSVYCWYQDNPTAMTYLPLANRRLQEATAPKN
jgi:O-antigen ligase